MGLEGGKRKKEKPKKSLLKTLKGDAIIAAGVLGAVHGLSAIKQAEVDKHFNKPELQKSDPADVNERDRTPKRYANFRQSDRVIDRRHESEAESMEPIQEFEPLVSREQEDNEYSNINSSLARQLDGRIMPRDKHSVNTWNKKNEIDHAIKNAHRDYFDPPLPRPDPRKKKK